MIERTLSKTYVPCRNCSESEGQAMFVLKNTCFHCTFYPPRRNKERKLKDGGIDLYHTLGKDEIKEKEPGFVATNNWRARGTHVG